MSKSKWRLSRTLARAVEVRPIEDSDIKYVWAAYRKGALSELAEEGMDATRFKVAFEEYVLLNFNAAWTITAKTKDGMVPVGLVFGSWAPLKMFMVLGGIVWFPWASKRNILEGTVAYSNRLRKEMPIMGFARNEHKRLYEVCCIHGIMRRVGTTMLLGEPVAVFEGKS